MKPHDGSTQPSLSSEFTLKSQPVNNQNQTLEGDGYDVIASTGRSFAGVKYDQDSPFDPKTKISLQKYMRSKAERRRQLVEELKHIYNHNKNREDFTSTVTPRMDRQISDLSRRQLKTVGADSFKANSDQSLALRRTGTVPASIIKQRLVEKEDLLGLKRSRTDITFETRPRPPRTVKNNPNIFTASQDKISMSIEGTQMLEVENESLEKFKVQSCYNLRQDPDVARYALVSQLKPMIEPAKVIKLPNKQDAEPKKKKVSFKHAATENTMNEYWDSKRKQTVKDVSVRFADTVRTQNDNPFNKAGLSASQFNQSNAMKLMRQLSST